MKILLPWFPVEGTSSYPDSIDNFGYMEEVKVDGTSYYLVDYFGTLELQTGLHTIDDYVEPPVTTGIRKITLGSFRRRFTLMEKVALEESTDSIVKVLKEDLALSTFVALDFDDTIQGMSHLVNLGILTEERKTVILLDGTLEEEYKGV